MSAAVIDEQAPPALALETLFRFGGFGLAVRDQNLILVRDAAGAHKVAVVQAGQPRPGPPRGSAWRSRWTVWSALRAKVWVGSSRCLAVTWTHERFLMDAVTLLRCAGTAYRPEGCKFSAWRREAAKVAADLPLRHRWSKNKPFVSGCFAGETLVGVRGFEPPASTSRT